MSFPEPDFEGLKDYLEREYSSDRFGSIGKRDNGHIVIRSGVHPAFTTFQKDLFPILHRFGYVMVTSNGDLPHGDSGGRHWIHAEPMIHAILDYRGRMCERSACRKPAALGSEYCVPDRNILEGLEA